MLRILGIFLLVGLIWGTITGGDDESTTPTYEDGTTITRSDDQMACARSTDNEGAVKSSEVCFDKVTGEATDEIDR